MYFPWYVGYYYWCNQFNLDVHQVNSFIKLKLPKSTQQIDAFEILKENWTKQNYKNSDYFKHKDFVW